MKTMIGIVIYLMIMTTLVFWGVSKNPTEEIVYEGKVTQVDCAGGGVIGDTAKTIIVINNESVTFSGNDHKFIEGHYYKIWAETQLFSYELLITKVDETHK